MAMRVGKDAAEPHSRDEPDSPRDMKPRRCSWAFVDHWATRVSLATVLLVCLALPGSVSSIQALQPVFEVSTLLLQALVRALELLFLAQLADKLFLFSGRLWIWASKYRLPVLKQEAAREDKGQLSLVIDEDGQLESESVLIQIPMCNERECYKQSIEAACRLTWEGRTHVQVLDDSDDEEIQLLIKNEVIRWQQKNMSIVYLHRTNRTGHKAGNLAFGMAEAEPQGFQFVVIFDADFMPSPDFLQNTVPLFRGRPRLALVQARWAFVNKEQNLLTRLQNVAECYHFEIEQQVMSWYSSFFGFNGTAGVWRISALASVGGWEHRTTVEDMDAAVRAHLRGYEFVFVNDVRTFCELPASYTSYCKQQHRWLAGPMQLFCLMLKETLMSGGVPLWKKVNLIVCFFWLRKLLAPFIFFLLFFLAIPASVWFPQVQVPVWLVLDVPLLICVLHVASVDALDPRTWALLVPNLLFENLMAVTKFRAVLAALAGSASMREWVVTKKVGCPPRLVRAVTLGRGDTRSLEVMIAARASNLLGAASPHGDSVLNTPVGSQADLHSLASSPGAGMRSLDLEQVSGAILPVSSNLGPKLAGEGSTSLPPTNGGLQQESAKPITLESSPSRSQRKIHVLELMLGVFLLVTAFKSKLVGDGRHFYIMLLQSLMMVYAALDYIGEPSG